MTNQREYLKFCRQELRRSKRWRDQDHHDELWRRMIDLYRGKHYNSLGTEDRLIVNIAFATKNVLGPAVAIQNPRFTVNARDPESAPHAVLTEEILNYLWRTHRYQSEFRLAVDDFICIGHGWAKVGYKFVKKPKEKKDDVDEGPDDADIGGVDDREDKEGNVESEMNVSDDRPFVERISPFDMYVDPDARHPKEMRWIAQRTWRAVRDVHVDERYSATARRRVQTRSWSKWDAEDGRDSEDRATQGSVGYCEIIEFYDIKRNRVSTFAMDGTGSDEFPAEGFLIKPKEIPYATGQPFVMLRNFEVPDHFYPIGDLEQIESLQLELNETRNQMMNHRKRFARKWLYDKDAFDNEGIAALEADIDNTMVPVLTQQDPARAVAPMPAAITPSEFYDQSGLISSDMDRVSGVSDYQRGGQSQEIRRTATEAAMIQDSANARAQDRLGKVEDILAQIAERIIAVMQQYLTGEHVARVVTLPGAAWLTYDKEYIRGQFDFEVIGGSTEPRNETFRRQSALQLVDASAPFIDTGIVNVPALYRKVLAGFGIKDTSEFLQEPPPPEPPAPPPQQEMLPGMPPGMDGGVPMPPQAPPMPPMPPGMGPMPPGAGPMSPAPMPPGMGPMGPPPMSPEMVGGQPSPEELMLLMQLLAQQQQG